MKSCERCARILDLSCFCKNARSKDGLNTWCRECTSEYKQKYRAENAEKISTGLKLHYAKNAEKIKAQERERRAANRDLYNKRALEYQKNNREAVYTRQRAWRSEKWKSDIQYRIKSNLRSRLGRAMQGLMKTCSAVRDMGCTPEFLIRWLEGKFTDCMTWENYGKYWHVDHVKPLSMFDLTDPAQVKTAIHFTNLQPLEASENIRKGGANRKVNHHEFL